MLITKAFTVFQAHLVVLLPPFFQDSSHPEVTMACNGSCPRMIRRPTTATATAMSSTTTSWASAKKKDFWGVVVQRQMMPKNKDYDSFRVTFSAQKKKNMIYPRPFSAFSELQY